MKKVIAVVLFVFFSPAVFAGRWVIPTDVQVAYQGNLDVTGMLLETEGMLLEPETLELGKTRFQSFVGRIAAQVREKDLESFERLFSRVFFLMVESGVRPPNQGQHVYLALEAFAQEGGPVLDCDTGCLTALAILQVVQAKYPHHQVVEKVYLVAFLGHALLAIRVKGQDIPEHFRYTDARLALPDEEELWAPLTGNDEWVEFVGKSWYLSERKLDGRSENEPFTPLQGKALQALSLAACAEWCLESGIQTSSTDALALDCLKQALKLHPTSSNARVNLAGLLFKRCDFKGALEQYRLVQEIELPPSVCLKWGKACIQEGAYAEAVMAFTRGIGGYPPHIIQTDDGLPRLLLARAEAFEALGKMMAAQEDRRRAASILILDPFGGLTPYGKGE